VIKNNSGETLPVEVIDQVPVYDKNDKEKMEVDEKKAFYDKKDGTLKWSLSLKANESVTMNYEYKIKTAKEEYEAGSRVRHKKFRTISCPAF